MHRDLIILRRPSPYYHLLQLAVALGFLFFGFWLGYAAGPDDTALNAASQDAERLKSARSELAELKDRYAALERSYQVEKTANAQTARELAEAASDQYRLEKEVALYKALVQPGGAPTGLSIAGFESTKLDANKFRFRLTLLDPRADKKPSKGEVSLQLIGQQAGRPKTLDLASLAGLKPGALKYQFQHFHYIDGELALPEGYAAEKVVITVKPAERGAKKLTKEFAWLQRS